MVTETKPRADAAVWGRFHWFAYLDPESQMARALCGSLGLYVVRPSVEEAVSELTLLVADYVAVARGQSGPNAQPDDIKRMLPGDAFDELSGAFCAVVKASSGKPGSRWNCGDFVVPDSGATVSA